MLWKLFLDDERYPAKDDLKSNWRIARNVDDAIYYIKTYGMPSFMSLDHDLGARKLNGKDFCNWLVNHALDNDIFLTDLKYEIHSMNPVGAANMRGLLDNYLLHVAQLDRA